MIQEVHRILDEHAAETARHPLTLHPGGAARGGVVGVEECATCCWARHPSAS